MYKIKSIEITGFWGKKTVDTILNDDVNIIIGKNGSGKTTFMNIVHAVLTVDADALIDNHFSSVKIKLQNGGSKRTIQAERIDNGMGVPLVEYHISKSPYLLTLLGSAESSRAAPLSIRRRAGEEAQKIREKLSDLISIASLSVYRIGGSADPELRERALPKNSVDFRLISLMQQLTQYQLELSNAARSVSAILQRDVLVSLLYTAERKTPSGGVDFDEATERVNLTSAYKQLGVSGADVAKKIHEHTSYVGETFDHLRNLNKSKAAHLDISKIDLSAIEAHNLARIVVKKSLEAEEKNAVIFQQVRLFLEKLIEFIPDKKFEFLAGELVVRTEGLLPLVKLSSGEKQLLILFIEALLQRQKPFIFLADEPELSLHIAWQRNILKAVRDLNPNSQIVVATHSPEIAGKFRSSILSMEKILHG